MPLPLPNLDTRTFDDLLAEMRRLIPKYAPEWTNHNPSDPGMVLVDILAWVTEANLYRINRIPEQSLRNFYSLMLEEEPKPTEALPVLMRRALESVNEPYRAITAADFEREAKLAIPDVSRVRVQEKDNEEGTVQVTIVAKDPQRQAWKTDPYNMKTVLYDYTMKTAPDTMIEEVRKHLDERTLVGTKVEVQGAQYFDLDLSITIAPEDNTKETTVEEAVLTSVTTYLNPITGGSDGAGYPFGRPVTAYDLYRLIESVPGVDHVETITLNDGADNLVLQGQNLPWLRTLTVNSLKGTR